MSESAFTVEEVEDGWQVVTMTDEGYEAASPVFPHRVLAEIFLSGVGYGIQHCLSRVADPDDVVFRGIVRPGSIPPEV